MRGEGEREREGEGGEEVGEKGEKKEREITMLKA